jgi:hypothetical protein
MTRWTRDELARAGAAEEQEVATRRSDGTPRRPVPVWVIRVGDGRAGGGSAP